MKFKQLSPTSFELSEKINGVIQPPRSFALPTEVTLWQIQEGMKILAALFKETGNIGEVLLSTAFSFAASGASVNVDELLGKLKAATGAQGLSGLTTGLIGGIGDILAFLSRDNQLAKIAAILFIETDETKLEDSEFVERTQAFLSLPANYIVAGIVDFFVNRLSWKTTLLSPSQTSTTGLIPTPNAPLSAPSNGSSTVSQTGTRKKNATS